MEDNNKKGGRRASGGLTIMNHPVTRARLAFGAFLAIIAVALILIAVGLLRHAAGPEEGGEEAGSLLVAAGEAELLERYTGRQALPAQPMSVKLSGMMVRPEGESSATFTVDGVSATLVVGDYIGDWQLDEITENGVVLSGLGQTAELTLSNSKLNLTGVEQ